MNLFEGLIGGIAGGVGKSMIQNADVADTENLTRIKEDLMTKREEMLQRLRQEGAVSLQKSAQEYDRPYKEGHLAEDVKRTQILADTQKATEKYQGEHIGVMKDATVAKKEIAALHDAIRAMAAGAGKDEISLARKEAMKVYGKMTEKIYEDVTIKDKEAAIAGIGGVDGILNRAYGLPAAGIVKPDPANENDFYHTTWETLASGNRIGNKLDASVVKAKGFNIPAPIVPKPTIPKTALSDADKARADLFNSPTESYRRGILNKQNSTTEDPDAELRQPILGP